MGEWSAPNFDKSMGVSGLSISSISHPAVHTLIRRLYLTLFISKTDMALIEIWMALVMLAGWFL